MAYDSNFGIVTRPVGIGDVMQALGSDRSDLATLCSSQFINPMAKFKPVRYSKIAALTDAERASTRYGMDNIVPSFTASDTNPSVTWGYNRVRVNTDWSRLSDFEGYFHKASVPFAFSVSGALADGVGITLYVDSAAATYYQDYEDSSSKWDSDKNLTLTDLFNNLATGQNISKNDYIGVCIHDMTDGGHVTVCSNIQIKNLTSSVPTFILYGEQRTIGGLTYPAIAMLNDQSRTGHTFRFIICGITSGNAPATGYAYRILANTTTVYSFAIRSGIDRKDIILNNNDTIMRLTCSLALNTSGGHANTLTFVRYTTRYGMQVAEYTLTCSINGIFVTPSDHWSSNIQEVGVTLNIRADSGWVGDGTATIGTSASVPNAGNTYNRALATDYTVSVYFPFTAGTSSRYVTISGYAYRVVDKVPFNNTLKIQATG